MTINNSDKLEIIKILVSNLTEHYQAVISSQDAEELEKNNGNYSKLTNQILNLVAVFQAYDEVEENLHKNIIELVDYKIKFVEEYVAAGEVGEDILAPVQTALDNWKALRERLG